MERIRGLQALAVCAVAAVANPADAANCDLGHAPGVPVVKTLTYKSARAAVLAGGWLPMAGRPHNALSDNETNFRDLGYTELQFCRMSEDSLCRFAFTAGPVTLWLTTTGDENPVLGTHATVTAAKLACGKDGDPG